MDNKIVKALQGDSWNGHPLHPALVSLPIGMWCLGATLDFIALFTKNECIQEAADDAVIAGLVGAGLAATAGLAEYQRVPEGPGQSVALTHAAANVSAVALNSVNAIVRSGRRGAGRPGGMLPKLLSWGVMGLVTYSGWLGGNLVFNMGTAVDTKRHHRLEEEKKTSEERRTELKARESGVRAHA